MLKKEVLEMKEETEKIQKEMEKEETFAMHLLKEIKQSSKRNFIAFIVTLIALVLTNIGWLIYESQWEYEAEDTIEQTQYDTYYSNMSGVIN